MGKLSKQAEVYLKDKKSKRSFKEVIIFVIVIIIGIVISVLNFSSEKILSKNEKTNLKKGKIEFIEEIHNFGKLKEGEIVSYSFVFKNIGESSFQIENVEVSCDCLASKFNKLDIIAGAESEVEVILKTDGEWGNQIKTLNVITSEGESKTLTVCAFVEE